MFELYFGTFLMLVDYRIYRITSINKLPQAYPLLVPSKVKLSDGSGVATMLSHLKSTHAFKQEFSSKLEWTILTLNIIILPSTMGLIAFTWVLSN